MSGWFQQSRRRLVVGLLATVGAAGSLRAGGGGEERALVAWFKGLPGANGEFVQEEEHTGQRRRTMEGRFAWAPPLWFRWEIAAPFSQVTVSDGREVVVWEPDLNQATVYPITAEVLAEGPMGLFAAPERLPEWFEVERFEQQGERRRWLLRTRSERMLRGLSVVLTGERLESLVLEDAMGQRTTVRFVHFSRRRPPQELFRLSLPPEALVVRAGR
ncbi:MAG: outer membrane lipoprotein carrier protein LolA [Hydrogenophilus sp.]|nr:outer membrane lipoprotein carrier protein LolA [Hydrogenophilus sp.]